MNGDSNVLAVMRAANDRVNRLRGLNTEAAEAA